MLAACMSTDHMGSELSSSKVNTSFRDIEENLGNFSSFKYTCSIDSQR